MRCQCEYQSQWTGCLYAYKGLLLAYGLLLAWETRNVTYAALNDSKYIGMSVYSVVMCTAIAAPLRLAVTQNNVSVSYTLLALSINMCTTSTLALLFVPKVRIIIFRLLKSIGEIIKLFLINSIGYVQLAGRQEDVHLDSTMIYPIFGTSKSPLNFLNVYEKKPTEVQIYA